MKLLILALVLPLVAFLAVPQALGAQQELVRHPEITQLAYASYDWLKNLISSILDKTFFQERPDLAKSYASVTTGLVTFTALYILLVVVSAVRKVVGWLLLLFWGLWALSILAKI